MKRLLGASVLLAGFLFGAPSTAQAVTIGPTCGTCGAHNTTFNITFAEIDAATHTYTATIVATYGAVLDYTYITAVGVKVDGANVENFVGVTGPDGQTWTPILGTLNNSGCAANPGEAFACTNGTPNGASKGAGADDTWVLTLDFDSALNLATLTGSFKARFADAAGNFVGPLISESFGTTTTPTTSPTGPTTTPTTTPQGPVPEPASLFLLGSGLVLAHQQLRRRAKASKA